MKIVCAGGGPAGLYLAILTKLRDPRIEVTVLERRPEGVTWGWGIVWWDDLLINIRNSDPVTASHLLAESRKWAGQQLSLDGGGTAQLGGYGYATSRHTALRVLTSRARELDVTVEFDAEVDPNRLPDADLIVASDGAGSAIRARYQDQFGTRISEGSNHYIWLGTTKAFGKFTFAFRETPAGWIWTHAYAFDAATSTCVVECPPSTYQGLGLDAASEQEGLAALERIFAPVLDGHPLMAARPGQPPARWVRFADVTNKSWWVPAEGRLVALIGDAAHTTHHSIGSGTKLALEDAIGLNDALRAHPADIEAALRAYQQARVPLVAERQAAAATSRIWFENAPSHIARTSSASEFAYVLRRRRDTDSAPSRVSWWLHQLTQHPVGHQARRAVSSAKRAVTRYRATRPQPRP